MSTEDREMGDGHEAILKRITYTEEQNKLPESVVHKYWMFKKIFDRMRANMGNEALALVAVLAGNPTPEPPVTFFDEKPQYDALVSAKFQGKHRIGNWKGNDLNKKIVKVQFHDNPEIRNISPTNVRLLTREEQKQYLPVESRV